ncbi:signal recognition particle subunit SRP72 [Podospora aff. communis PSN243]|uniref:Signal recognition particle subunit SRP72 n=1 Tax=Podospora aff. communis PSN243 TaxID=3040156 RepID=A0AAV9H285_9PEZI|nr:signal recognition particle subunit SRP72 [Podospora aff. communis PSN243]
MADPAIAALNSLLRRTTVEDHNEALKLANAAIKAAKGNSGDLTTAQHTRVVALLKLDRFQDALRAIAEGGNALQKLCVLEKSYALYKNGELDAAEELLQSAGAGRGMKHVAAQVAYRSEKFEKAAAIYRDLATEDAEEHGEESDLRINLAATHAQLEWQGKGGVVPEGQKQPGREDLEAFETAYNAACGCISRGDFAKAAMLLKRSRDLCEATEDLDDEEKKAELVPILIQQAYVFTKLGKLDEATALYKSLDLSDVSDESTKIVAKVNTLILEAGENPYLTQRRFESLPVASGNDRLFGYQATALRHNKFVIDLQAQKFNGVQKTTTSIIDGESDSPVTAAKTDLGVLNAAAVSRLQTGKDALRRILPLLERRPNDVGLLLIVIQLYIQLKNPGPALNLLEAFFKRLETATTADHADVRFAPGLVALAVALYRQQGQHAAIRRELAKAAAHWQGKGASNSAAAGGNSLIREAGIELLRSAHPSDLAAAGEAFSHLVSTQPGDRTATAGLVASFATSDFAKVQPHISSLPAVQKAIDGVDVDDLIDAGVAVLQTAAQPSSKKRSLDDSGAARQQPAKKPRKRKLPKDYDPNKKPDPERWLPLRDRSSYRPKGKKGKKRAAETTQGGVVRDEEILELAGGAGSVKVEKAPAGGGGGGGKKKKKGKK